VDHHVHHDADIGRAERVAAGAGGLDVFGVANVGRHGGEGRVETFDVADLERDVFLPGERDQIIGLGGGEGQRFFDE